MQRIFTPTGGVEVKVSLQLHGLAAPLSERPWEFEDNNSLLTPALSEQGKGLMATYIYAPSDDDLRLRPEDMKPEDTTQADGRSAVDLLGSHILSSGGRLQQEVHHPSGSRGSAWPRDELDAFGEEEGDGSDDRQHAPTSQRPTSGSRSVASSLMRTFTSLAEVFREGPASSGGSLVGVRRQNSSSTLGGSLGLQARSPRLATDGGLRRQGTSGVSSITSCGPQMMGTVQRSARSACMVRPVDPAQQNSSSEFGIISPPSSVTSHRHAQPSLEICAEIGDEPESGAERPPIELANRSVSEGDVHSSAGPSGARCPKPSASASRPRCEDDPPSPALPPSRMLRTSLSAKPSRAAERPSNSHAEGEDRNSRRSPGEVPKQGMSELMRTFNSMAGFYQTPLAAKPRSGDSGSPVPTRRMVKRQASTLAGMYSPEWRTAVISERQTSAPMDDAVIMAASALEGSPRVSPMGREQAPASRPPPQKGSRALGAVPPSAGSQLPQQPAREPVELEPLSRTPQLEIVPEVLDCLSSVGGEAAMPRIEGLNVLDSTSSIDVPAARAAGAEGVDSFTHLSSTQEMLLSGGRSLTKSRRGSFGPDSGIEGLKCLSKSRRSSVASGGPTLSARLGQLPSNWAALLGGSSTGGPADGSVPAALGGAVLGGAEGTSPPLKPLEALQTGMAALITGSTPPRTATACARRLGLLSEHKSISMRVSPATSEVEQRRRVASQSHTLLKSQEMELSHYRPSSPLPVLSAAGPARDSAEGSGSIGYILGDHESRDNA